MLIATGIDVAAVTLVSVQYTNYLTITIISQMSNMIKLPPNPYVTQTISRAYLKATRTYFTSLSSLTLLIL